MTDRHQKIRDALASIKTLARYEPDTVYIGTGEYVAECVRADDGDYYLAADVDAAIDAAIAALAQQPAAMSKVVAWAYPVYARPAFSTKPWEEGDLVDIEFHLRPEKPEGEGWRPLVFAAPQQQPQPGEGDRLEN